MERSYLTTLMLLVLHQIDAAYWEEWNMFLLPGGVQGYLLFNALAFPILFLGYRAVILRTARASSFAYLTAGLGLLTGLIHSGFWLAGYPEFKLFFSAGIIVLLPLSSVWLIWRTVKQTEVNPA